jgi:outer membrane lipoprotein LolB
MGVLRWLTLIAAALLLAACAAPLSRPPPAPWPQRLTSLRNLTHYRFDGRMAANVAGDGFSAGLRWSQDGGDASVDLSAPLGFDAAHLTFRGGMLSVTTSHGEQLTADAAAAELSAQLGFEPPLRSLRYWLVGASDPANPGSETLDPQQRLMHLDQDGWSIDYADYAPVASYSLPRRVTLQQGTVRVRIVINAWQL